MQSVRSRITALAFLLMLLFTAAVGNFVTAPSAHASAGTTVKVTATANGVRPQVYNMLGTRYTPAAGTTVRNAQKVCKPSNSAYNARVYRTINGKNVKVATLSSVSPCLTTWIVTQYRVSTYRR